MRTWTSPSLFPADYPDHRRPSQLDARLAVVTATVDTRSRVWLLLAAVLAVVAGSFGLSGTAVAAAESPGPDLVGVIEDIAAGQRLEIGQVSYDLSSGCCVATRGTTGAADDVAGAVHGPPPPYARSQYGKPAGSVRSSALDKTDVCPYCGNRAPNTLDHVRAQKQDWVEGGWADDFADRTARINDPDNLVGACGSCNSSKGAKPIGQGEGEWWPPGWGADDLWPFGGP